MSTNLSGKTAVVLGVADRESIAWAIACRLRDAGAQVTIGYQQKFYSRIRALLQKEPSIQAQRCDVMNPDEVQAFFQRFENQNGLDVLVHSVAFAPAEAFSNSPSEISSTDFSDTLEVSVHSLSRVIRFSKPYLNPWASVITLSFQASMRAMPLYGLMGTAKAALESLVRYLALELGKNRIRINTISPGPIETLASLSEMIALKRSPEKLKDYFPGLKLDELLPLQDEIEFAQTLWRLVQSEFSRRSPIPEVITASDVADTALFLASPFSRKMTGQILTIDCGFSSCLML